MYILHTTLEYNSKKSMFQDLRRDRNSDAMQKAGEQIALKNHRFRETIQPSLTNPPPNTSLDWSRVLHTVTSSLPHIAKMMQALKDLDEENGCNPIEEFGYLHKCQFYLDVVGLSENPLSSGNNQEEVEFPMLPNEGRVYDPKFKNQKPLAEINQCLSFDYWRSHPLRHPGWRCFMEEGDADTLIDKEWWTTASQALAADEVTAEKVDYLRKVANKLGASAVRAISGRL